MRCFLPATSASASFSSLSHGSRSAWISEGVRAPCVSTTAPPIEGLRTCVWPLHGRICQGAARRGGGGRQGFAWRLRAQTRNHAAAAGQCVGGRGATPRTTLAPNRNEVAAAVEVLALLSLDGCIVTADALHCHARDGATHSRSRRPICSGAQSQPIGAVRRRADALGAYRSASASRANPYRQPRSRRAAPGGCGAGCRAHARKYQLPRNSKRWHASNCTAALAPSTIRRWFDTSCSRSPGRRRGSWPSRAPIGASKTACTGCSASSSTKTSTTTAGTMGPKTSPFCASLHSTFSARIPTRPPYAAKSSTLAGTTPSFSLCSPKCDSPALAGR